MKRKLIIRYLVATLIIIMIGWALMTIYVESSGPSKQWVLGNKTGKKILIVYDPDPFYNLDEQVCMSLGKALAEHEMSVRIVSVAAATDLEPQTYDAVVYCANTYNWRPDWSITRYVKSHQNIENGIPIVAITLGAGSTKSSQENFEKIIINSGGKLIGSYSLWLWRPNDETRPREPNVDIAVSMAYNWGKQIAEQIK